MTQKCDPVVREECGMTMRTDCTNLCKEDCQDKDKKVCMTVPHQECEEKPVENCQDIPKSKCRKVRKKNHATFELQNRLKLPTLHYNLRSSFLGCTKNKSRFLKQSTTTVIINIKKI